MNGSTKQPKVFISYSWTNPQHEAWILELGERLLIDGILVILDKWDLKEGQDKYAFMERMVSDKQINKVLVVCDRKYQEKADGRDGGVGTESQIISKKVYDDVGQEKFIPVVSERGSDGEPYLPTFMASRIYIDLSVEDSYEGNYQRLVKNLYGKPSLDKPTLGSPPPYVTETKEVALKTIHKTEQVKTAILNDKKNKNALVADYFSEFLTSLKDFAVKPKDGEPFDDALIRNLESLLPLRDDFINFTRNVFKYDEKVNLETFHDFFEQLITFEFKPKEIDRWRTTDYDNYLFFNYELFLYFISTLLDLKKYKEASYFINNQYFFRKDNVNELIHLGPSILNRYVISLDEVRKSRLKLNRVSVTADLIKERATRTDIPFSVLTQNDLVLHYLTALNTPADQMQWWFPRTSVYNTHWTTVELFERLVSKKHFEYIKDLFEVKTREELKNKISTYAHDRAERHYDGFYYHIPELTEIIKVDEIATV